jgi:hypothetical protein
MKNKIYKEIHPGKEYCYLRLGDKAFQHLVFEFTPEKDLTIFIGKDDTRIKSFNISEEGKILLKDFINKISDTDGK